MATAATAGGMGGATASASTRPRPTSPRIVTTLSSSSAHRSARACAASRSAINRTDDGDKSPRLRYGEVGVLFFGKADIVSFVRPKDTDLATPRDDNKGFSYARRLQAIG